MNKKLIIVLVVGFVMLTVIVAVRSAHKGTPKRPVPPTTPTNQTLNLDTSPSQFPQR